MRSKQVALLCYFFPPNTGVGGRRWVKFCSSLVQENVEVTVFTPKRFTLKDQPSWQEDVAHMKGLKVIEVEDHYPKILLDTPSTFLEKLSYKFHNARIGSRTEGNKYDPSAFWEKVVQQEIKPYLAKHGINNLVVSGIPFHYFYDAAKLKEQQPELNLVLDFRDLWTDSLSSYGANVRRHQPEKYAFEKMAERFSVEQADHILCASEDLTDVLQRKYPQQAAKMQTVLNGFDPADIESVSEPHPFDGKIKIAYIGTINCSHDYYIHLIDGLKQLQTVQPALFNTLQFDFYGNTNLGFQNAMQAAGFDNVSFHGRVNNKQVKKILRIADMVLYIKKEDELMNSFASKFFEYLCARKFVLILSPEGKVTQYIRDHKIGCVLRKEAVAQDLKTVFNDFIANRLQFNAALDISEFRYDVIAQKVNALLK